MKEIRDALRILNETQSNRSHSLSDWSLFASRLSSLLSALHKGNYSQIEVLLRRASIDASIESVDLDNVGVKFADGTPEATLEVKLNVFIAETAALHTRKYTISVTSRAIKFIENN